MKLTLLLLTTMASSLLPTLTLCISLPPSPDLNLTPRHDNDDKSTTSPLLRRITYTGPRYTLPASELAKLALDNGTYTRPADMPLINLDAYTVLDFGSPSTPDTTTNHELQKRNEFRRITVYNQFGCNAPIRSVENFGCSSGCITWIDSGLWGWSGKLEQGDSGSPYPTAHLFTSIDCTGGYQKIGINGFSSCTSDNRGGFRSFFAYYNC